MVIRIGRLVALAWVVVGCGASILNASAADSVQRQQIEREKWMLQMCPRFAALLQEVYGYPRPSSQSQRTGTAKAVAVNRALQDEFFTPVFGKGFDKLAPSEVELLDAAVGRCNSDYKRGKIDETYYVLQYQELMLKDLFSVSRFERNLQQAVKSRRSALTLGGYIKEMAGLSVSAQSVLRLNAMSSDAVELLAAAPDAPSSKAFPANYEKARVRIEIPVERNMVTSQISSARGYDGLHSLLQVVGDLQSKVSSGRIAQVNSSRGELLELLGKKISSLDAEQAAAESAAYRAFADEATGLAAMIEAKTREATLEKMYGAQLNMPEFAQFNQERRVFREQLISQNEDAFINIVTKADTMPKVKALTKDYLVDADLDSAPAKRWIQIVDYHRTKNLLQGLRTDGLMIADDIEAIFTGDFDAVKTKNNGIDMDTMVGNYIDSFWKHCPTSLPANKVQLMRDKCDAWNPDTYQQYGFGSGMLTGSEVPGSRVSGSCAISHREGTGVWADPEVLELQGHIETSMLSNIVTDFTGLLEKATEMLNNPMGTFEHMLNAATSPDMDRFLALNSCSTPVTKKFQENLIRYGWGRPPVGKD